MFLRLRCMQLAVVITALFSGYAQAETLVIEAGPIWNQQDAERKCPNIAASVNGKWTGQWWTTVQGRMSVCQINVKPRRSAEQRCFDKVQGKVAWSQNGDTRWKASNVRRLCHNVDRPKKRIRCFKRGIRNHNDWERAIAECGGKAQATRITPEKRCYNLVQGKVAWDGRNDTSWKPKNVRRLCKGTNNPQGRVNCFKRERARTGNWNTAVNICNGTAPRRTPEEVCYDKVQGKVAWDGRNDTSWKPKNVRRLCQGTTNPQQRVNCFKRERARTGNWNTAVNICNGTAPRRTPEEVCYDKVQGKVAWDGRRDTSWKPKNVRRLCQGTTNPQQRVNCFKRERARTGNWNTAVNICNGTAPRRTPEQVCYDKVQGKVAWDGRRDTSWKPKNVRRLCKGTTNPQQRVNCFKRERARTGNWNTAVNICNGTAPRRTPEQACYDKVQGKVAWNKRGDTKWAKRNVLDLCEGVSRPNARIACFTRGIKRHNSWRRAIDDCKADVNAYRRTGIRIDTGVGVSTGGSSNSTYTADVEAGPIWSNADAQRKCTDLATRVNGTWTGQWRTTVQGRMSVCEIKFRN